MNLMQFPEINPANYIGLTSYWQYMKTYRYQVDESKLIDLDIAMIFISPGEHFGQ